VTTTTRAPRKGEVDGRDYHFVTDDEFERMKAAREFFEHTQFGSAKYGATHSALNDATAGGRVCVTVLDIKGSQAYQEASDKNAFDLKTVVISVDPDEIQRRLGLEDDSDMAQRLARDQVFWSEFYATDFLHGMMRNVGSIDESAEYLEKMVLKMFGMEM
jgi:guanylate kinase